MTVLSAVLTHRFVSYQFERRVTKQVVAADQDIQRLPYRHGSSAGRLHNSPRAFGHVQPLFHALLDQRHVA